MIDLVGFYQMSGIDVGVDLGRIDRSVSQEDLDDPEVDSAFQEVSREAVPEGMGCDLSFDIGFEELLLEYLPEPHAGHLFTQVVGEEDIGGSEFQDGGSGRAKIDANKL